MLQAVEPSTLVPLAHSAAKQVRMGVAHHASPIALARLLGACAAWDEGAHGPHVAPKFPAARVPAACALALRRCTWWATPSSCRPR